MLTIQTCVDSARLDLGDATTNVVTGSAITPRYPDTDLIRFANDGIAKALVIRPDLNYGNYGTGYVDLVATASFPLPAEYLPAIVAYCVARNQSGDDAFVLEQRAAMEMQLYLHELGIG